MKKMQKISAIIIAAVTILSTYATNIYATGWEKTENGDKYQFSSGKFASDGVYNIDGVLYKFSKEGIGVGKYSGWTVTDGVRRFYSEGLPYTGLLKNSAGQLRRTLDGYLVLGSYQSGTVQYDLDENGYITGQKDLALSAECGTVTTADDHITVKLTMLADGHESFGALSSLERWDKGEWADPGLGDNPVTLELHTLAQKGDTEELTLYLNGFKLTKGFYRIPINNSAAFAGVFSLDGEPVASGSAGAEHVSTYAYFEVTE